MTHESNPRGDRPPEKASPKRANLRLAVSNDPREPAGEAGDESRAARPPLPRSRPPQDPDDDPGPTAA